MNTIKCLIVGGPKDGQVIDIESARTIVEIARDAQPDTSWEPTTRATNIRLTTDRYFRVPICHHSEEFHLLVPEGRTADWAIGALVESYRRHNTHN